MKKETKGLIIVLIILFIYLLLGFLYVGIMIFFPTCSSVRNKMCEYYQDDGSYDTIYVKINKIHEYDRKYTFDVQIDSGHHYGYYLFTSKNADVLKDNSFFEEFDSEKVYEICVNEAIWWDGGKPFAVALKTEDKVYLDFETGKANLIDWILNDMY